MFFIRVKLRFNSFVTACGNWMCLYITWFTSEGAWGVVCKHDSHGLSLGISRQPRDILDITNFCHLGNRLRIQQLRRPSSGPINTCFIAKWSISQQNKFDVVCVISLHWSHSHMTKGLVVKMKCSRRLHVSELVQETQVKVIFVIMCCAVHLWCWSTAKSFEWSSRLEKRYINTSPFTIYLYLWHFCTLPKNTHIITSSSVKFH